MEKTKTEKVLEEIAKERSRQDHKWGEQNHDPFVWIGILIEEVGEVSRAAVEARFNYDTAHVEQYRKELTHVAAVAAAMIECFDRAGAASRNDAFYPEPRSAAEVIRET